MEVGKRMAEIGSVNLPTTIFLPPFSYQTSSCITGGTFGNDGVQRDVPLFRVLHNRVSFNRFSRLSRRRIMPLVVVSQSSIAHVYFCADHPIEVTPILNLDFNGIAMDDGHRIFHGHVSVLRVRNTGRIYLRMLRCGEWLAATGCMAV